MSGIYGFAFCSDIRSYLLPIRLFWRQDSLPTHGLDGHVCPPSKMHGKIHGLWWASQRQRNVGFVSSMDPGSPSAISLGRPGKRKKTGCRGWGMGVGFTTIIGA